jgi:probable F420-dependent oxidoreductase
MPRPFRFGVQLLEVESHHHEQPAALVETAHRVESLGYDELFTYDHFGAADPFVPLMVAAMATERLRVGPLVLNNELHHPALLARTAATLDHLSGGRLVLGLGTGYMQAEHDAIDVVLRPPRERVDRFGESLMVLRQLLDTGRCEFEGGHHRVAVHDLGVRPVQQRVPFLIGGHGRRVVRLASRYADIFQFTGLVHGEGGVPTPGGFALDHVAERARWLSEEAGPRDAEIERSVLVQSVCVGCVPADAQDRAARYGLPLEVLQESPFVLWGSVAEIVEKLVRLREWFGISHVVVRDPEAFAPVVEVLHGH